MTDQPQTPTFGPVLKVAELAKGVRREVVIEPDAETCAALAEELGLLGLRKVRFAGALSPLGRKDWRLEARLGATVVQPCGVTLAPVTTRLEEEVRREWIAGLAEPEGDEVEVPDEVDRESLGAAIDLGAVMVEALALALPAFPRAEGAELGAAVFAEPGTEALTDEAARPFAGLAALRDKLGQGEPD